MNKVLFSVFILLTAFAPSLKAKAAPYITYPDFVLMPMEKKFEVIHMMQDYAVEYEQQSRLYVLRNKKQTTFYEQVIKQAMEAFISSAYALHEKHGTPCMYAGWPSVMEEIAGNLYCNNPTKYSQALSRYTQQTTQDPTYARDLNTGKNYYSEVSGAGAVAITYDVNEEDRLQINLEEGSVGDCGTYSGGVICNPLVFGKYKNKPLCVKANSDDYGYNASFLCERAVQKIKRDDREGYTELMSGIIQEAMSSPDKRTLFLNNMEDMYDMCLCSQDPNEEEGGFKNGRIEKEYADRIFFTRTCAGILYQTKSILDYTAANQQNACPVFTGPVEDNKDWLKFVRQAHANIEIEQENLGNDFVQYLELSDQAARASEQTTISERRLAAKAQRNGSFCPIDIEPPRSCVLSVVREPGLAKVTFSVGTNKSFEDYTFEPQMEFQAGDDGSYLYTYALPENVSEDFMFRAAVEGAPGCEQALPNLEEEPKCELKATLAEEDPKKVRIEFTPAEGKNADDYTFSPEGLSLASNEGQVFMAGEHSLEEEGQLAEFTASSGEADSCSATVNNDQDEEGGPETESDCSLELALADAENGKKVIATIKDDGEAISPSHESGDEYSVTFRNNSIEEEEASSNPLTDADEMVGDSAEVAGEEDAPEGREIASTESEEEYAAVVAQISEEQIITATVAGPNGCSDTEEIRVPALEVASEPSSSLRGGPQMKQPNLIQKRPKRGGYFMRGNR